MRVLIVGLGSIANKHIDALRKIDLNIEISALRRKGKSVTTLEGIENVYEINSEQFFDFAIISNPTSEHANTLELLKDLKIPLFIEKPLFNKLNHEDLISELIDNKIPNYVACNLRFLDCIKFLKNIICNKVINEVNIYCGSFLPDWRPDIDFRKIYSANKDLGGGVHIDLIHEIDYLVYLFGFPKDVIKTFRSNSSLKITAFDYANYLFFYDNFCANVILNYYRKISKRTIEIICDDGVFDVDLLKNEVFWNSSLIFKSNQLIKDTYEPQMKYFINEVWKKKSKNMNNIKEAYNILKLCLED